MKHKLIMENWKRFLKEEDESHWASDLPTLDPQEDEQPIIDLVRQALIAGFNYLNATGSDQDDALQRVIQTKVELDQLQGTAKEFADKLIAINKDKFGTLAGAPQSFAAEEAEGRAAPAKNPHPVAGQQWRAKFGNRETSLGPGDIDLDKSEPKIPSGGQ